MQQAQRLIGIAGQLFEPEIRNLPPEIVAGHVFHLVRFVENHRRVFRQNAAEIVLLQRQVCKEQMMIYDDQVGFLGVLVHARHKTGIKRRAILSRARVPPRVQLPQSSESSGRKVSSARSPVSVNFAQSLICRKASISSMPFSSPWSAIWFSFERHRKFARPFITATFRLGAKCFCKNGMSFW